MDYNLPGSSVHGIFQARVLEWGATAFSVISFYIAFNSKNSLAIPFTHLPAAYGKVKSFVLHYGLFLPDLSISKLTQNFFVY